MGFRCQVHQICSSISTGSFSPRSGPRAFPGGLAAPHDFSVDPDGNLYVANPWNFNVASIGPEGRRCQPVGGPAYKVGT